MHAAEHILDFLVVAYNYHDSLQACFIGRTGHSIDKYTILNVVFNIHLKLFYSF